VGAAGASNRRRRGRLHFERRARRAADKVRGELGNRLTVATSGGAALDSHVADVIKRDLRVSLVELYATRETGGVARDGVVYPGVVVKLLPTEATASSSLLASSDVGQICVHSPRLIDGYVGGGNDSQFIELDGKRFYCTGDIGEFVTDDAGVRRLRVIGRATEHRKRADGTWFALPSRIEALLEQCAGVSRACVIALPSGAVGAVTVGACDVDEARLRLRAAGVASQDMPTVFVTSDQPLAETPNGKLDRRAVQERFESAAVRRVADKQRANVGSVGASRVTRARRRSSWATMLRSTARRRSMRLAATRSPPPASRSSCRSPCRRCCN
jgi:acyl-CoA synthetase (AMP-forming)/AMP-acid ligase II